MTFLNNQTPASTGDANDRKDREDADRFNVRYKKH
jgi:hypothetical protein